MLRLTEEPTTPVETPAEPEPPTSGPPASGRPRWRRAALRLLALLVAIVAGVLVTFFTVDLGPQLKARAEREGSNYMHRPLHIGRLSVKLTPGVFVFDDVLIEGLEPGHRPFLKARRIEMVLPWWSIFTRKLTIASVEMTDWDMLIETWPSSPAFPNGRHNFPKFTRDSKSTGPKRFTTTLRSMLASRGSFTYEDHGTPWGVAARDLRISLARGVADTAYLGRASFSDSTITIQKYEPFPASMQSRFTIDGSKLHFSRIDLASEGAQSVLTGDIDMGRWPEQTYQISSKIDFPAQKNIFFHRDKFQLSGKGDFHGTFHLFKGGRELKGTFSSPLLGVNAWRFPDLRGSVLWVPDRMEVTNATSRLYGGTAEFDYRLAPLNKRDVPIGASWEVAYTDVDLAQLTDFLETKGLRLSGRATGRNHLDWKLGKWSEKRGEGEVTASPPAGTTPMTRELRPEQLAQQAALSAGAGPVRSDTRRSDTCRSPGTSSTRSIRTGLSSARAGPPRRRPTSSSRGGRRTASSPASRFT